MDYTITLTETEKMAMETITQDVSDWITNAALNRARIVKEEIITSLVLHCNTNGIDLASGEDAQMQQAYDLGVAEALTDAPLPSDL